MDVVRFDLQTTPGYCEFLKQGLAHIPGMIYISKSGKQIERTEQVVEKEQLRLKLENLLKQP